MLLSEFVSQSTALLEAFLPSREASSVVSILCEKRLGVKSYTHVTEPLREIAPALLAGLQEDMRRLCAKEPVQYVLGETEFYGRRFKVNPAVLIPRPETEILVSMALEERFSRALDLCTGSGCIAWSLAMERAESEVVGIDVSEDALAVARSQFGTDFAGRGVPAEFEGSAGFAGSGRVSFIQGDVLLPPPAGLGSFDLVVSNPPYIMESEKAEMSANVLDYEPALALFVKDDDPLVFYRAVASWCDSLLSAGGRGIVEINEKLGERTAGVFSSFKDVRIVRDLNGRQRFVSFRKSK